jgi:hypothetical protein
MNKVLEYVISKHIQPELNKICVKVFKENFYLFLNEIQTGLIEKDKNDYATDQAFKKVQKEAEKQMKEYFEKNILGVSLLDMYRTVAFYVFADLLDSLESYMNYEEAFDNSEAGGLFYLELKELRKKGLADTDGELIQFVNKKIE